MPAIPITKPTTPQIAIGGEQLTIGDVDAVASRGARVVLPASTRGRIERSHEFLLEVVARGTPVYGLTTGCGPLAANDVDPAERALFQRNLIRSHAVSLGAPLPAAFVRAAMTVRAHVLARGFSGVHPATVDVLVGMLNAGITPVVREVGSVGASGDLVELAQIALAAIGEDEVSFDGATTGATRALRAAGVEPLVPVHRDGLALINGTSCHTGTAAVVHARAARISRAAQIAAAVAFEALRGKSEALDDAFQRLRPHAGQAEVAAFVRRVTEGSSLLVGESPAANQDAYTLRCIPQVLGAALDALEAAGAVIATELDSVIDNPLFLAEEGRVVHGGNFHGQPVAMALDQIKTAAVEIGVMSERRLARLLDPLLNDGLPAFLVPEGAPASSGFMGLQYCASSMAADNAVLAAPASVRSVPTNGNNQDVVSMGMVAARQTARVLDNVERMVAIELLCAAQALELRGAVRAGAGTRAALAAIREHVEALTDDRPLRADVEAVCGLIDRGELVAVVDRATS